MVSPGAMLGGTFLNGDFMDCGIYMIKNTKTDKVYIGQSKNIRNRVRDHKAALNGNYHRNIIMQRSYNKNKLNFEFHTIIKCCEGLLNTLETYYISKYKSNNRHCGFNLDSGGNLNKIISNETRKKQSKKKLGSIMPKNTKLAIYSSNIKPVIDITTGIVWESAKIAAYIYNYNYKTLCSYLNGYRNNKTNLRYV